MDWLDLRLKMREVIARKRRPFDGLFLNFTAFRRNFSRVLNRDDDRGAHKNEIHRKHVVGVPSHIGCSP